MRIVRMLLEREPAAGVMALVAFRWRDRILKNPIPYDKPGPLLGRSKAMPHRRRHWIQ